MTYETNVRAYKNIPFEYRLKKAGYYDIKGSLTGGWNAFNLEFQTYTGVNMSYYQGVGSLMTVTSEDGMLPDLSYLSGFRGCLAEVNGGTGVYTNYTKVGTPNVDIYTGLLTGVNSSKYIVPNNCVTPDNKPWEIVCKFTTDSTWNERFIFTTKGVASCFPIYISSNNLRTWLSSNGSSWNISSGDNIMVVSGGVTYKVKAEFTGTEYNWYLWENDSWVLKKTISSSTPVYAGAQFNIGHTCDGFSIDLSETYMKVDGQMYWSPLSGTDYIVKKQGYVNYTKVGTPTIDIDTGEVSNFSNSNYLYENFGLSSADSWEINTAFMVTSNTSARRQVISSMAGTGGVYAGVSFLLDANNYIVMQLGLTTSSYDNITTSFTVSPNTKYYLKGTFDGSTYEFKYSTDRTNYTSVGTISSTAKIYQSTVTRIGVYGNAVSEPLTNGTIYLADTNISVNGSEYWNPVGDYNVSAIGLLPTGVTDDGSAQTWNLFYNSGTYLLNTTSTMTGYTWVGSVAIPAHTV